MCPAWSTILRNVLIQRLGEIWFTRYIAPVPCRRKIFFKYVSAISRNDVTKRCMLWWWYNVVSESSISITNEIVRRWCGATHLLVRQRRMIIIRLSVAFQYLEFIPSARRRRRRQRQRLPIIAFAASSNSRSSSRPRLEKEATDDASAENWVYIEHCDDIGTLRVTEYWYRCIDCQLRLVIGEC